MIWSLEQPQAVGTVSPIAAFLGFFLARENEEFYGEN